MFKVKVIEVKDLTRSYKIKGNVKHALKGVSFEVEEGEVFGLLGPNGAGKTTTIKILTTMLLPTSGKAKVLGYDVNNESNQIRKKINFVYGGEKGVYGRLTAKEYLRYFCTLYKIPSKNQDTLIEELLNRVQLKDIDDQKINTFSKGMIQRLHIARSLINEPKIIFLDEPTVGLDPIGAKLLRNLVKELSQKGITIILTTHYMQEADELCDRVAFIKNGKINLIAKPSIIKQSCNHLNLLEAMMNLYDLDSLKKEHSLSNLEIVKINESYYSIKFQLKEGKISIDGIKTLLSKYGEVLDVRKREISLEDAFIHYMKDVV